VKRLKRILKLEIDKKMNGFPKVGIEKQVGGTEDLETVTERRAEGDKRAG
jgi:hypothetical protein